MDSPEEVYDAIFDESLIRKGTIVKTEYQFSNGEKREKFFIILNKFAKEDPLVCVITTSQLDFYIRNLKFNDDALTIAANTIPCFNKDTVVDCRQIYCLTRKSVREALLKNGFKFVGELPDYLIEKIDAIVCDSRFISKIHKRKILEN